MCEVSEDRDCFCFQNEKRIHVDVASEATDQRSRHLYGLQLADGRSECGAFECVVCGTVQRRLSDAESLRCDADPSAVQSLLSDADKQEGHTHTRNQVSQRCRRQPKCSQVQIT